jgi:hypothetical protein
MSPTILFDLLALAGAACVAVGLWWIYPPACLIVSGSALSAAGIVGARAWARLTRSEERAAAARAAKQGGDDAADNAL